MFFSAPNFVSSLEDEDFVYFFFREAAVEHINCGKSIFSRVARVCKSDTGGKHKEHAKTEYFFKNFMKEGKKSILGIGRGKGSHNFHKCVIKGRH